MSRNEAVTVATPLYDVKLDSRGAVATSWIVKQNRDTGRPLYSVAGDKNNRQPLELIPAEALRQKSPGAPLLLATGDAALDNLLASKNFKIDGLDDESGNEARIETQKR
jgi:hypothetical protein